MGTHLKCLGEEILMGTNDIYFLKKIKKKNKHILIDKKQHVI